MENNAINTNVTETMGQAVRFFETDTFWALVGLILFLALLIALKVPAWLNRNLDSRAVRISNELDEARRLRDDAQQLLAEYQRKRAEAEKEAADIVSAARREAEALAAEARKKTEDYVERRKKLAEQKISQAEADAINAVRAKAVDIAIVAAGQVIGEELTDQKAATLFKSSLDAVKTRLN